MQGGDPMRRFTTTEGAREPRGQGAREQGSEGARERGSAGAERRTSFFLSLTLSLALSLCFGTAAQAACHVVTPSGAGSRDGSTWNNAFASLPATLVRGDTYYIGTGLYSIYRFNTPESGTQIITIKKAISTDHCTDIGYNDATMGVGQAIWRNAAGSNDIWLWTCCGFWVIDGQQRTGRKSGHGFKLDNSPPLTNAAQFPMAVAASRGSHINNI